MSLMGPWWEMVRKFAVLLLALCGSEALVAAEVRWGSLRERIYAGQFLGVLPGKMADGLSSHRFDLPSAAEGPVSFGNFPSELNLSYLSVSANGQQVVGMGNLVSGSTGAGAFVQAVKTVLVTWAKASDWPEWAERDETGYDHLVEAGIYGVQRSGTGEILDFEYVGASQCLVHVPWRPTVAPDGSPYPYNGYAFEVTIPFLDPVECPEEYVVLISYDTESAGANPIGESGPYNALNYGLRQGEPRVGVDPDPNSLVQVTPEGWNYSASWGGLGSVMTEVLSREEERMAEVSLEAPSDAGATVTALYDGEDLVEQALVRIRPRPVTVTALQQERRYGDVMLLDEAGFTVLDQDGDSVLPNGELIEVVHLESATQVDRATMADAGVYADEITIVGQEGSSGFKPSNYEITYVRGDLLVRPAPVNIDLGEGVVFRCGRGRGLWVQTQPEGVEVDIEYNGVGSLPETLGEHAFRLRVLDPNYEAAEMTGTVRVVERTYAAWSGRFLSGTEFQGPEDDPDFDGINNLLEFALDTDPLTLNQDSPVVAKQNGMFSGVIGKELAGASLALEASSDLQSWQEIVPTWENEDQARGWSWSSGGVSRAFLRLRVDLEILD